MPELDSIVRNARVVTASVSAFGDPGLGGAKELLDIPVVGISEAAPLSAWHLGRRFSIVCLTPRLRTWYTECVAGHGLAARLAAVRARETGHGTVAVVDATRGSRVNGRPPGEARAAARHTSRRLIWR